MSLAPSDLGSGAGPQVPAYSLLGVRSMLAYSLVRVRSMLAVLACSLSRVRSILAYALLRVRGILANSLRTSSKSKELWSTTLQRRSRTTGVDSI